MKKFQHSRDNMFVPTLVDYHVSKLFIAAAFVFAQFVCWWSYWHRREAF